MLNGGLKWFQIIEANQRISPINNLINRLETIRIWDLRCFDHDMGWLVEKLGRPRPGVWGARWFYWGASRQAPLVKDATGT